MSVTSDIIYGFFSERCGSEGLLPCDEDGFCGPCKMRRINNGY
jgi:hypothetical protein